MLSIHFIHRYVYIKKSQKKLKIISDKLNVFSKNLSKIDKNSFKSLNTNEKNTIEKKLVSLVYAQNI